MKTVKTTLALVTLIFAAFTLNAQSTQFVKLTLAENSNDASQIHNPIVIAFNNQGHDSLTWLDAGNEYTFGQYNSKMFPFTTSSDSNVIANYDARPELLSYRTIPFGIVSKTAGHVKIIANFQNNDSLLGNPGFVWIEQLSTGEKHSLLDTVKLDVTANTNFATDFLIHIGPPSEIAPTHETCFGNSNGTLNVQGPNYAGFTHELTMNNVPLFTSVVAGTDTLINNLSPGNYVSVIRINGIPVDSVDFSVAAAAPLIADFATDYNTVTEGTTVNFTDYSVGGLTYSWDFGDGNSTTSAGSASNQYTLAGAYMVTLDITDANGCVSSTFDNILVEADTTSSNTTSHGHGSGDFNGVDANNPTGADNVSHFRNTTNVTVLSSRIMVDLGQQTASRITVVSMNGNVVANGQQTSSIAEYAVPVTGAYIVTVEYTNGTFSTSTVLVQ